MVLKRLDGCKECQRLSCQFNRMVAGEYAIQSKAPYGCSSLVVGGRQDETKKDVQDLLSLQNL